MAQKQKIGTLEIEVYEIVKIGSKWTRKKMPSKFKEDEPLTEKVDLYDEAGNIIGKHTIPVMEEV